MSVNNPTQLIDNEQFKPLFATVRMDLEKAQNAKEKVKAAAKAKKGPKSMTQKRKDHNRRVKSYYQRSDEAKEKARQRQFKITRSIRRESRTILYMLRSTGRDNGSIIKEAGFI